MTDQISTLVTRTGLQIHVRPARPDDDPVFRDLFQHVSPEDLRFRFLTGLKQVSAGQIEAMTHLDRSKGDSFIAFDGAVPVGAAMLACDAAGERGEVAVSIRADYRQRGVGWVLLAFVAQQAEARGLKVIESIESRANHAAIELERNMGFTVRECPGDPTLVLVSKQLGATQQKA